MFRLRELLLPTISLAPFLGLESAFMNIKSITELEPEYHHTKNTRLNILIKMYAYNLFSIYIITPLPVDDMDILIDGVDLIFFYTQRQPKNRIRISPQEFYKSTKDVWFRISS